ncbi:MAG: hypothetical protein K6A89_10475 [Treponema sp.]|nr:hypothetical protein [Treponema sp.]
MKKLIILFCFISSFFFFSCASKPEDENLDEQIENVTTSEDEEQNDMEDTESENSEGEEDDVIFLDDEEETSVAYDDYDTEQDADSLYPVPQDFEEPLVLTLDVPPEEETEYEETEENDAEIIEFDEDDLRLLSNEDAASEENEAENTEAEAEQNLENEETDDEITSFDTIEDNDDVIDIESDDFLDADEDNNADIENEEVPIPSRKVTLKKNEYVEITYPGTGWIFLGLTDGSRDIAYYGTKLGSKDTTFSLQARKSGTKILHFYKSDALTNEYLDDYVEVEVTNENGSNKTHIIAPEFKMPVPQIKKTVPVEKENQEDNENSKSESENDKSAKPVETQKTNQASAEKSVTETVTSTDKNTSSPESNISAVTNKAESSESNSSVPLQNTTAAVNNPQTLLQEANILYNEKEFEAAKNKLNQYLLNPDSEIDRAYFLLGQILEAKSSVQDIKAAINAYTNVTKNYPASKYWEDANKRIIYLKRFYLEAR